jgi:hypothetical protein
MAQTQQERVLYIVACAAPPTRDLQVLIRLAQADQWKVASSRPHRHGAFSMLPSWNS